MDSQAKTFFPRIPYAKAIHGPEEVNAVLNVLNTSTQMGAHVSVFESKVADLFSKSYGVMVNSGSSANLLAIEIADLPKGSEVITPVLTFPTTVSPLVRNNLIPHFIDVTPGTYLINHEHIERAINKNTSAIFIPNLIGNMADWEYLRALADRYNLILLEDSCDTLGAVLNKTKDIKDGFYADIVTTSFYGSHFINCAGNGGLLAMNSEKLAERARVLRSWGRYSSKFQDIQEAENIKNRFDGENNFYDHKFLFSALGYNLEPSELGAAFGLEQLKRLDYFLNQRKNNFLKHQKFFKNYQDILYVPKTILNSDSDFAWLSYPLTFKSSFIKKSGFSRNKLQQYFESFGIQTRPIFTGNILRQPGFENIQRAGGNYFPVADEAMEGGILLGCHPGLTDEMITEIHERFSKFIGHPGKTEIVSPLAGETGPKVEPRGREGALCT